MAKKKGKRKVKAERGTLFNKKGSLFQKKQKDSATKKFIDVDNSDEIELTKNGEEYFDSMKKQKIAQTMEHPILLSSQKFKDIEVGEGLIQLTSEKVDIDTENIMFTLKVEDNIWIFTQDEAILLDMVLEKEGGFKYDDFKLVLMPLLHNNKFYFVESKKIRIFDLTDNSWTTQVISGTPIAPLSVYNDNFYLVTDYSKLTCFDETFKEVWTFSTEKYLLNIPEYKDNFLFVSSTDGILYQLEAKEGELIWSYNFKSSIETSTTIFQQYITVISMDGKIHFVDYLKKDEIFALDTGFALFIKPIIVKDSLYIFNRKFIWKFSVENEEFSYQSFKFPKPIEKIYPLGENLAIIDYQANFFILNEELELSVVDIKSHKKPLEHLNNALMLDESNIFYKAEIS